MKPYSVRDIVGPIMVGPSSSHTAGALRIARMTRNLLDEDPVQATFTLYGSFAHTYRGHGTDRALVAGMLGMHTDDLRIRDSFELAREAGLDFSFRPDDEAKMEHPNTIDVAATGKSGREVTVRGVSVGGGAAELSRVNGIKVRITGEFNNMIIHEHDESGVLAHIAGELGRAGLNIASSRMYRTHAGGDSFTVMDVDEYVPDEVLQRILAHPAVQSVRFVPADGMHRMPRDPDATKDRKEALEEFERLDFASGSELLARCEAEGRSIAEVVQARELALLASKGAPAESLDRYLARVLSAMRDSVEGPAEHPCASMGGLVGGEAAALRSLEQRGGGLDDQLFALATRYALAVLETNASMGLIVAAPTAGSSGVIPAVLLSLQRTQGFADAQLVEALKNAAAVGMLIARNATVAGAEGGCQAEIGSASAMAASAATQLLGGTPRMCLEAASIALSNMLGLVCDPVGGLVELPCQKRNATGATNALAAAQMALAGITGPAPFDEVVEAMYKVGRGIPYELRETALGGIAACPSCKALCG